MSRIGRRNQIPLLVRCKAASMHDRTQPLIGLTDGSGHWDIPDVTYQAWLTYLDE